MLKTLHWTTAWQCSLREGSSYKCFTRIRGHSSA